MRLVMSRLIDSFVVVVVVVVVGGGGGGGALVSFPLLPAYEKRWAGIKRGSQRHATDTSSLPPSHPTLSALSEHIHL